MAPVKAPIKAATFWFRPYCLAVLTIILLFLCLIAAVLFVGLRTGLDLRGVVSAITGGPAPVTISSVTVLERVQALQELHTVRYVYSSYVNSQRDMPDILKGLYGDNLVMIAVGYVEAGIDMSKLSAADVTQQGDTITIKLPSPQLLSCYLDENASQIVARDTGIFARPASNLDQEARRFAIRQARDDAVNKGVLDEAKSNAQTLVTKFVSGLGVKNVSVVLGQSQGAPVYPDSCQ